MMTSNTGTHLPNGAGDNVFMAISLCLFRNVLQNWLTTKSIAALDLACCERQQRDSLFSALKGSNVALSVDQWFNASKSGMLVRWILTRHIRLSSAAFAGYPSPRACVTLLQTSSEALQSIKLYNNSGLLTLAGTLCKSLRNVELHSFQDRHALSMFLFTAQNSIERLVFCSCQSKLPLHLQGVHFAKVKELTLYQSLEPPQATALIRRCPNLSCLKLCTGNGRDYSGIVLPSTLKYLVLEGAFIAVSHLHEAFRMLPMLEAFSYGGYDPHLKLPVDAFNVLLRNSSLLSSIKLGMFESVETHLAAIRQYCPGLKRLSLSFCHHVYHKEVALIFHSCPMLVELALNSAPLSRYDSEYAAMLMLGGRELQVLDLCGSSIGSLTIAAVAQLPNLRELGLCRSTFASRTHGFDHIAKHAPQLRTVRIAYENGSRHGNGNHHGNSTFTPLICRLWEATYPHVRIVTDREHSSFWQALDIPAAPPNGLLGEPAEYSDSE